MKTKISILAVALILGITVILIGTNIAIGACEPMLCVENKCIHTFTVTVREDELWKACWREKALREKKQQCYKECEDSYITTLALRYCEKGCDYAIEGEK